MKNSVKTAVVGLSIAAAFGLVGCASDADRVSSNLSKDAEQFEVTRRITVVNGITDKYLMVVEGRCSLEFPTDLRDEIVCKLEDGTFVKHHVMRGDNVMVMSEQVNGTEADVDRYTVIFKPESILPNVEVS